MSTGVAVSDSSDVQLLGDGFDIEGGTRFEMVTAQFAKAIEQLGSTEIPRGCRYERASDVQPLIRARDNHGFRASCGAHRIGGDS